MRISESCVVVCFLGNRRCNSPRQAGYDCELWCVNSVLRRFNFSPPSDYWDSTSIFPSANERWQDECGLFQVAGLWSSKVRVFDHVYNRRSASKTHKSQLFSWVAFGPNDYVYSRSDEQYSIQLWSWVATKPVHVYSRWTNIQPSCVAGQPLKQLTMNGHIQAERSCTAECICVFYDPVLTNHVSLEITDINFITFFLSDYYIYLLQILGLHL